jgi:hypothetical protein
MSLNFEHDNIFDTENDDNPIFPFLSDNIIESEENLSDYTTGITGQMFQESLKKKRNRDYEPDEDGSLLLNQEKDDEIKIFDPKIDKENKKVCKELTERIPDEIYKNVVQIEENVKPKVFKPKVNECNCKISRFDGTVKKVKKLFIHYVLKTANDVLKKEGILKEFRIPSHDFTRKVTIESNKKILTIDVKTLFTSKFENDSQTGDILRKKIEDNLEIFKNHSLLEIQYSDFFFSPLENLLKKYLDSDEFLEDVKKQNEKCKKNPIQLNRIIGEGEFNFINYIKGNKRYGVKY